MNPSSFRLTAALLVSTLATGNGLMMAPLATRLNSWGVHNSNQSPVAIAQEFANSNDDNVVEKSTAAAGADFDDGAALLDDYKKKLLQTVYERTMERSFHTEDNRSNSRKC